MVNLPSRDFLVRQSVLRTVAKRFPVSIQKRSAGSIMSQITVGGTLMTGTPELVSDIRSEFRALVGTFGQQVSA